jgi:hydrogenase nickel incorporation protein HypA/HybF
VHELALCQGLLRQVEQVAFSHGANAVERIRLKVGRLSGVEPPLLERAFEIARFGTVAQNATLEIETGPIVVACDQCGASGAAAVNRLLCPACGDWRVRVTQGEELVLQSIDIEESEKEALHV